MRNISETRLNMLLFVILSLPLIVLLVANLILEKRVSYDISIITIGLAFVFALIVYHHYYCPELHEIKRKLMKEKVDQVLDKKTKEKSEEKQEAKKQAKKESKKQPSVIFKKAIVTLLKPLDYSINALRNVFGAYFQSLEKTEKKRERRQNKQRAEEQKLIDAKLVKELAEKKNRLILKQKEKEANAAKLIAKEKKVDEQKASESKKSILEKEKRRALRLKAKELRAKKRAAAKAKKVALKEERRAAKLKAKNAKSNEKVKKRRLRLRKKRAIKFRANPFKIFSRIFESKQKAKQRKINDMLNKAFDSKNKNQSTTKVKSKEVVMPKKNLAIKLDLPERDEMFKKKESKKNFVSHSIKHFISKGNFLKQKKEDKK